MTVHHSTSSMHRSTEDPGLASRVLDSLNEAVAVIDRDGLICATNEAWRKFAIANGGTTEATGIGVNYLDICRTAQGDDRSVAKQAYRGIRQVLSGTKDIFRLEYPCHSPSEKRWYLLTVSPLKGDPRQAVTTHASVTERKRFEMRLLEAERLAAIGQAMQGLSHEGRNSLQRAQGCIDLLRCHVEQDSEAVNLISKVESAQRRLISLYEEVRRYASPITLQRVAYPLDVLVQEIWQTFEIGHDQFRFLQLPSSLDLRSEIDVAAIGQVFRSLFENAISKEANSSLIELCYAVEQLDGRSAITVIVSDNGDGIPINHREQAFQAFFTTKIRGTGLGLTTSRRIVEAHGGRIYLGDGRLGGASVFLTLPVTVPGNMDCASSNRIP